MPDDLVDFFISYNRHDLRWAQWIDDVLNRHGYTTLVQYRDCHAGMSFPQFMHKALKNSTRTLGILSRKALEADYVQAEWENTFAQDASGKAGKLLLVRVEDCMPDGNWSRMAFLDLVGLPEDQLEPVFLAGLRGTARTVAGESPLRRPMQHKKFVMGKFAGREQQVRSLMETILSSAGEGNSLGLYALRGMGGVGKSRMAAELADRLYPDTARFPGGVLWCNLLEEAPEIAARKWLQALDVNQSDLDAASAFEAVREAIARRRPLVVCDNVQHPDQTRELLVSAPGVVTLITTREERNIPVSATRARVDVFTPEDAAEMVEHLLVEIDPEQAARLCQLCGFVPLFIEVACRAITERRVSIKRFADSLEAKGLMRLEKYGLDQHDTRSSVVFESSYETLTAQEQSVFALLSQFPGASFGTNFIQALLHVDEFDAEDLITALESRSLMIRLEDDEPPVAGREIRFRFHDLVREFAVRKITRPEETRRQLTACWADWNFVEAELRAAGAYELSGQYHRLNRQPDDSAEYVAWHCFIRGQTHVLADSAELFYQQALNEPRESPVSQTAAKAGPGVRRPERWLEWINRPKEFSPPACEQQLTGHQGWIYCVAVTPDGRRAVSGSQDRTVRVWDLSTGEQIHQLLGHQDTINSVAISPDGLRAVSASSDETLRVWDLATGEQVRKLVGHQHYVLGVAITEDFTLAISAAIDQTLRVWDLNQGRQSQILKGRLGLLSSVAITPDGSRAVSASFDRTLRVWDLTTGEQTRKLTGHDGYVLSVAITPDGSRAVSASADRTVRVWDLNTGTQIQQLNGHEQTVNSVAITPDGAKAVSTSDAYDMRVWDLTTGEQIQVFQGHQGYVLGAAITADGSRAASASSDQTVRVWNLATGRQTQAYEGQQESVNNVAITPDGSLAVSASSDQTVRVWDLTRGKQIQQLEGHEGWILSLAITPDGSLAVSASSDQSVRVWDLTCGRQIQQLDGHQGWVYSVAITPDGSRAVSASDDHTLRIWDLASGQQTQILEGHQELVYRVAITPDGRRAVSSSLDQTVRIWDLDQGNCLAEFPRGVPPDEKSADDVKSGEQSVHTVLDKKGIKLVPQSASHAIAYLPGQFTRAECSVDGRVLIAAVSSGETGIYHLRTNNRTAANP